MTVWLISLFLYFHVLPWMLQTGSKNNGLTTWMFAYDDVMISGSWPCLHEIVSDGCFSWRIPLQGDTARHQIRAWQWHSPSVISGTRRSQGSMCFPQRDPGKGRSIGGRQELPDVSKSSAERERSRRRLQTCRLDYLHSPDWFLVAPLIYTPAPRLHTE